jgi:hypothetical protein
MPTSWITMTTAAASIIYAVSGYFLGQLDLTTAMFFISGSGIGAGLGRKVDKNTAAVQAATIIDVTMAAKPMAVPVDKLIAAVGGENVAAALHKVLK